MVACQQQLGGKPLVLQEFGKKPGGPGRTLLFTEVSVVTCYFSQSSRQCFRVLDRGVCFWLLRTSWLV
jgi:hypothetical protein